ncbi:hypothetical protein XJ44_04710 [Thermosipho affectus]|uniref:Uncharacterized protein n=2 Tax=Thermosipho affectus TaxID=660294 RepID=A0ABX3IIT3_9BACT|nr:hypothetical protein XJ44_04710 [Thermosipho affectus]
MNIILFFVIFYFILRYVLFKYFDGEKSKLLRYDYWNFFILILILFLSVNFPSYVFYFVIVFGLVFNIFYFFTYRITFVSFILNLAIIICFLFPKYIWVSSFFVLIQFIRMKLIPMYNWIYVSSEAENIANRCKKGGYSRKPVVIFGDFGKRVIINGRGIIVNVLNDKMVFRITRNTHRALGEPNLYEFCEKMSKVIRGWLDDKSGKVN